MMLMMMMGRSYFSSGKRNICERTAIFLQDYLLRAAPPACLQDRFPPVLNLFEHQHIKTSKNESPRPSVAEHLAQTLLLVGTQHCGRLQVDVDVGVHRVVAEVVLGQQWMLQLDAALLDHLMLCTIW